jgi:hypothetical protein
MSQRHLRVDMLVMHRQIGEEWQRADLFLLKTDRLRGLKRNRPDFAAPESAPTIF